MTFWDGSSKLARTLPGHSRLRSPEALPVVSTCPDSSVLFREDAAACMELFVQHGHLSVGCKPQALLAYELHLLSLDA